MTKIKTVAGRAKAATRRAELAGQQRAGAYSRRQIRIRHREVLREHWRHFGIILIIGLTTCLGAALLLPDEVSDFAVGAIAVITLWVSTSAMRWMDGMANHRLGVVGEEWTADELRKLRKRNWRVINHVMLDKGGGDIDHALLGSGGSSRSIRSTELTGVPPPAASTTSHIAPIGRPSLSSIGWGPS